jgi:hypothetical protein
MAKNEHDRPDWNRGNTFVTLGEAQDKVIADAIKAARAEQMSVLGVVGGPVGVPVGETTGAASYRVDSRPLDSALTIRRLTNELSQARLVAANALADVAAARNALELSIRHQDARHNEAMAKQQARHDAKVAELNDRIAFLASSLTKAHKAHDDVLIAAARGFRKACSIDAVEWHAPAGPLPRGMR